MATKETIYANVTSAADVALLAVAFARGVQIEEDGSGAAAGLQVTWPDGTVCQYLNGDEPLSIGNITGSGSGPLVGVPARASSFPGGVGPAATQYCLVRSLGATTKVRVVEFC